MINRQAKKFFDYYLKIVATEEYQSYYQRHEQEGLEFHKKCIEEKHPEWRHGQTILMNSQLASLLF